MQEKQRLDLSLAHVNGLFLRVLVTVCVLLGPINTIGAENSSGMDKALVIYFSRTGNTEAMAREIASRYQADIKNFRADEYSEDFSGSIKANMDAWNEKRVSVIDPETIDLRPYKLIFLGSPIWWYRPAVPLWSFVEKNDFQGKNVVLFNTFNSQFKAENIAKFQALVEQKGGVFLDHIYVRRGRVYNQIDREELLAQVRGLLASRESKWIEVIR
ncbi:MAG: flavodoxin/nitric oxide synthase [Proteobacteria bacterium]|nr:flavodoxin/nitric oxide synthase [Pseudomonadota bacterium]